MARVEDQRIIIWCNYESNLNAAIIDAVYLAIKLEKEVCLFANYNNKNEENTFHNRVANYAETIKKDFPKLPISILLLEGKLSKLVKELGEKYNTIMFCTGVEINTLLLKAFYQSGFPFYFAKGINTNSQRFNKVIIPIDFRNSTKDATLWGSYMGRFNQSEIILLQANEKANSDQHQKVMSIVAFVKKFYGQFYFNFWFENGLTSSWGIHKEATKKTTDYDLLIFTGSFNVTFLDRLIGPFELRLVQKSTSPVLLMNPQKEMFVLCN